MSSSPFTRQALSLALALVVSCGAAYATPLDDLRRQVEASQFEQAYATAQANAQLIGDVHFDFLYGVAAINVGHVAEGLLALERHLSAVPANDRARLELARGYFLLGEYTRARAEFAFVLRYDPPVGVRNTIAGFLQAMQVRESTGGAAAARLYAEVGVGRDTNVNGGTYRTELQLISGNINLAGSPSKQVPDYQGQLAIGGQQLMRVTNRLSVFVGADLDERANFSQRAYDQGTFGAYVGFTQLSGAALWRVTLGSSELLVGGQRYRDILALSAEANLTLPNDIALTGFVQYGEQRHAAADEVRDSRSTGVGVNISRAFPSMTWAPQFGARLSFTQDDNVRARGDLSKAMPYLRAYASVQPLDRLRVLAGVTAYWQKYGGEDIAFLSTRNDRNVSLDMAATYAIDAVWSLRADGSWQVNRSNQGLYDTKRKAASFKLRYQY